MACSTMRPKSGTTLRRLPGQYVTQRYNNHRKQGGLFHSSSCFKKGKMRAGLIVYKDWQLATLLLSFQHY
jgi:hypothetical protein